MRGYLVFGIWYLVFGIGCLVFGIWYLVFGIWNSVLGGGRYAIEKLKMNRQEVNSIGSAETMRGENSESLVRSLMSLRVSSVLSPNTHRLRVLASPRANTQHPIPNTQFPIPNTPFPPEYLLTVFLHGARIKGVLKVVESFETLGGGSPCL